MKLITAINLLGYIGKDGKMLWKSPEDFQHFKKTTMGGCLIVGSKTFEECLGKRMLPGRTTFVVGKNYNTLFEALEKAIYNYRNRIDNEIWVIGGEEIYNSLVHLCDEIHISHIKDESVGDKKFVIPENYRGQVIHYEFPVA